MRMTLSVDVLQFPCSNFEQIMNKLCGALGESRADDVTASQAVVSFDRFMELIQQKAPGVLTEHELRTLARYAASRAVCTQGRRLPLSPPLITASDVL